MECIVAATYDGDSVSWQTTKQRMVLESGHGYNFQQMSFNKQMALASPDGYTIPQNNPPAQNMNLGKIFQIQALCYLSLVLFYIAADVSASVTRSRSLLQGLSGKGVLGGST